MNPNAALAEALEKYREVIKGGPSQSVMQTFMGGDVRKDYPSGLVAYDLEPAARVLQPVITPLRNRIPRVKGKGGTAANWKQITSLDTNKNNTFSTFGTKAPVLSYSSTDRAATYKALAMGDNVAFENIQQAEGLEDAKAQASVRLLQNVMLLEEQAIIGSRNGALGSITTPTVVCDATGSISDSTYYVVVRAVTALAKATAANIAGTGSILSRGKKSAQQSTGALSTSNKNCITASTPVVDGAVAYEWYVGTSNDSTSEKLEAVTTINSVRLTTLAATGVTVPADNSADSNSFDGLLSLGSGTGTFGNFGYSAVLATGTNGTGTQFKLSDIDTMLLNLFQNYGADPEVLVMSPQQGMDFTSKCRAAGLIRFVVDDKGPIGKLTGGSRVTGYINPVTSREIEIVIDPWWPVGSIVAMSFSLPVGIPLGEINNAYEVKTQLDYFQIDYAIVAPKYEFEVRSLECVAGYFLLGTGGIWNIANG